MTHRLFKVHVADAAEAAVAKVLRSGYIGEGPETAQFEASLQERFSSYVRVVNSGTAALWLAYQLAGIEPGDVVLSSPLTCLAANELLLHFGAEIRWVDVDPETGGMCFGPRDVNCMPPMPWLRAADDKVKAVVVCDWGGDIGDLKQIARFCGERGIPLIEDAAHAFGNPDVGKHSDFPILSFQAIKTLTTGDGGALLCRHAHHAEAARLLRWFGLDRTKGESMRCYQSVPFPGFKFQMNDITAAVGNANLAGIDEAVATQRHNATVYDRHFGDGSPIRPLTSRGSSSFWLYTVRVKDARTFIARMAAKGIECSQVHARNDEQPIFAKFRTHLPGMDTLAREMVCLPNHWALTPADVQHIAETALAVVKEEGWQ